MAVKKDKEKKKKKKKKKTPWKRFSRWFQKKVGPNLGPPLGTVILRAFSLTMSKKAYGHWRLLEALDGDRPVVIAFWHGRLLMLPVFYERYIPHEAHVLISLHTDGQIISRLIENFGIFSIRGSSRRGGKSAGMKAARMLKSGIPIGFTPDGPRGPGEVAKRGVIEIAYMTRAIVFPLSYATSRQVKLGTWDKFVIPIPFSRLAFYVGEPIELDGSETRERREEIRLELERRLTEAGGRAEELAKNPKRRRHVAG